MAHKADFRIFQDPLTHTSIRTYTHALTNTRHALYHTLDDVVDDDDESIEYTTTESVRRR